MTLKINKKCTTKHISTWKQRSRFTAVPHSLLKMIQNIFDDSYKNSALRSPLWEKREFRSVEYARQGSSWKIMKENRVKTEVEGKTGKGV